MTPGRVAAGVLLGAILIGAPVAAWVHYAYARAAHRAARAALPIARRARISRFGALLRALALAALIPALLLVLYWARHPQR